ncbi:unnamed protein product, partial [Mesorhabditis spiculigera]
MSTVGKLPPVTSRRLVQAAVKSRDEKPDAAAPDPFKSFYYKDLITTPAMGDQRKPVLKPALPLKFKAYLCRPYALCHFLAAGAYYETGFQPVSLLADSKYCCAYSGGVGQYKMGNYAPTIWVNNIAAKKGCQQKRAVHTATVIWSDSTWSHQKLHNRSRRAVGREFKVTERTVTMNDVRKALKENRIVHENPENGKTEELHIPTMESKDNLLQRFYITLTDIQYGRSGDMPQWTKIIN